VTVGTALAAAVRAVVAPLGEAAVVVTDQATTASATVVVKDQATTAAAAMESVKVTKVGVVGMVDAMV